MSKNDDIAIKVSNVSKSFKLPHERHTSVKGALVGLFNSNKSYEKQTVLKDISFEIKKGEFFGIVGRNGSGKSTLLKLLAGIYSQDKGQIQVNGKLTPFIELGVGFNPELTGRENVFLNGALLGFSRKEMEVMYDEIVEFAELEKFMDQKLKNYSSGMQVRLAFSIAIRSNADIYVFDEVLAVGDSAFQQKCREYFAELKQVNKTIVLVTHDMESVRRFCDRGVLLEKGVMSTEHSSSELAIKYENIFFDQQQERLNKENTSRHVNKKPANQKIKVRAEVRQSNKTTNIVSHEKPFSIRVYLKAGRAINNLNLGINIINESGNIVLATNLIAFNKEIARLQQKQSIECSFNFEPILSNGTYYLNVAAVDSITNDIYFKGINMKKFKSNGNKHNNHAIVSPIHDLRLKILTQDE